MWPVHTWLPDAHVEAPTAGSVILAGVLLKMGGYGFVRFSLPMFPLASAYFTPLVFALSAVAIIYTSLVALAQDDMKKLIAYSSVAHMGFVTMGIFTVTTEALQGAMIQMLSHGLVSAALFLCVGVVYDRLHTREIARYGGLADNMPNYALCLHVPHAGLGRAARHQRLCRRVPVLLGTFQVTTLDCFLATTALFLGAMYMLYLYRRVVFGDDHPRRSARHARSVAAREGGVRAADRCSCCGWGSIPTRSSSRSAPRSTPGGAGPQGAAGGDRHHPAAKRRRSLSVVPAKAGTHGSAPPVALGPASAGTTS